MHKKREEGGGFCHRDIFGQHQINQYINLVWQKNKELDISKIPCDVIIPGKLNRQADSGTDVLLRSSKMAVSVENPYMVAYFTDGTGREDSYGEQV